MALHTNNSPEEKVEVKDTINMSNQGFNNQQPQGGVALSFGMGISGLMSANQGSDYTNGVAKTLSMIYEGANKRLKPKVHVLDKETFTNLAYSSVIVTLQQNKTVNYFVILLEETGRKPLTAAEVMSEWETSIKLPGSSPMIYTADDAINNILHNEITKALAVEYGTGVEFQTVDGIVLHKGHPDLNVIGPMLATIAYNACYVEAQIDSGACQDLNIEYAVRQQQNKQLRFESNMSKSICVNEVGKPVRSDWKIDLTLVSNGAVANNLVLNAQNTKAIISRVGGFVDALPEQVTVPGLPGQSAAVVNRFRPHIVVTSMSSESPTMGYMLVGLASSIVMANKNMWLAALRPTDKKVQVGNLNIISKIDDGQGQRIDFSKKDYSAKEVYAGIMGMFSLDPMISVDVESFGPQSFYTSVLSAAAQPGNSDEKLNAGRAIVAAANQLTGGRFPADYNPAEIFAMNGVVIPLGTWSDKTGDRDLREIDLTFLASHVDDQVMLNKWILSNLPMNVSGYDSYITKVDIIRSLIPSAEITGKAVRVTFTSKFINTLSQAISAAGMNVRYEPEISFTEDANLSIMSSHLAAAGLGQGVGFAKEVIQAGPSYQTPYINMGYGRFQ